MLKFLEYLTHELLETHQARCTQLAKFATVLAVLCSFPLADSAAETPSVEANAKPPNVVVIFIDDMGYADIGPFGAKDIETPNLNKMAEAGMRFTDFQVSSAVCSASRSALLTGCYHVRVGIRGAFFPYSRVGINSDEVTLAEICKQKDYATACFGKWHLGDSPKFLPPNHGFDEYLGVPYSNDMWPFPNGVHDMKQANGKFRGKHPFLPLIDGTTVVDDDVTAEDQAQLTTMYTERAVKFIDKNKDKPFFLYVPHTMVHVPIYVSDKFKGKSKAGLYGDVVMELDWSVGQINEALKRNGLEENTLVVFTSDNGPWLNFGNHAGTAGPLREGKGTMWEGGCRVPTVMKWPKVIPAGTTCDELASTIDLLPTVANQIGAKLPEHKIDGVDIIDLMKNPKTESPHEYFYQYYGGGELHAVRDRQWKLHFAHPYRTLDGKPGGKDGVPARYRYTKLQQMELYDLKNDVSESKNVIDENPDVLKRLLAAAEVARKDLGDKLQKRKGNGVRPAGRLNDDDPKLKLRHPKVNSALNAAIKSGEIKIDLKPMSPTPKVQGIRWSPKGTKIALAQSDSGLTGQLKIGNFDVGKIQLEVTQPKSKTEPGNAVLKIDSNGDGEFTKEEILKTDGSLSRGSYWYSFKSNAQLPFRNDTTRDFPISLWHVVKPDEAPAAPVLRWSRNGWHEGQGKIGGKSVTAVISDGNADGIFTKSDSWGVALNADLARSNSMNNASKHCWADGVAYKVTSIDKRGRFLKIKAVDLGITEAEDRQKSDPLRADKAYKRASQPVQFVKGYEEALAIAKRENKKVVIDFVTTWCGPCRTMDKIVYTAAPVVDASKGFVFVKLDGDTEKKLVKKYDVQGYPTIVLADDSGKSLDKAVGYQSVKKMLKLLTDN